jgi:hypothetical protein
VNWFNKRVNILEEVLQFSGTIPISKEVFRKIFARAGFKVITLAYKKNVPNSEFATIIYGTAMK